MMMTSHQVIAMIEGDQTIGIIVASVVYVVSYGYSRNKLLHYYPELKED